MANTLNGNVASLQVPGNNLNDAKQPTRPKEKLTRTLSASTLRDRLSKLATTPLHVPNPVATLHANVKYVSLSFFWLWAKVVPGTACSFPFSFVPAKIPRKRRLQMLAVAVWSVSIAITTVAFLYLWYVFLFFALLLFVVWVIDFGTCSSIPPLWPFLAVYLFWVRCIDKSPENGGRTSQWFRSLSFWKYFADYYPASYVFYASHCDVLFLYTWVLGF